MFVGAMYVMTARGGQNGASFILITIAAGFVIYWVREIRKMSSPAEQKVAMPRNVEQKDWVYDLIKNNDGAMVFVAEVPGPEDQIDVRLSAGMLKIKGGQNFARDVQLDMSTAAEMGISDYKYRNGVLTIRMQKKV
ncbi:HSP20-like chaperone [Nitrososphaera viennensis EN76]|uniref:HSP20-like chaperone n=2 Tax=Nitrososphaera viennensis TaxID=1034015 RepID=A0A060HLA3_9ARCH|nr:HSP20-like chaperone [Nitrososphaera viennensis EN76]